MVTPNTAPRRGLFRRRREREEDRALTRSTVPAVMLPDTGAGVTVSPRSALAVADAYACVRALADSAASLPLHVYRTTADGGRERIDGGTAELLRNPAPGVSGPVLVAQMIAHLNLWGEAFLAKYRDGEGAIAQLGLISPDRVSVEVKGGMPIYGIATEDGRFDYYGGSDLVHVKGLSLDGLRGLSPVKQAREALGLASALTQMGSAFAANGARPSGVLTVAESPTTDEVIENLKENWQARHGGPPGAGRTAILSSEVSFTPVSMPLHDAQFLEQRELSTREVARIFRVPSWLINGASADSLTYSTVAESMRAFVLTGLKPWLVYIEGALAGDPDLFPPGRREYPLFELDGLLRGDPGARASVYAAALDPVTGWMTRAEVRRLEDLPAEMRTEGLTDA